MNQTTNVPQLSRFQRSLLVSMLAVGLATGSVACSDETEAASTQAADDAGEGELGQTTEVETEPDTDETESDNTESNNTETEPDTDAAPSTSSTEPDGTVTSDGTTSDLVTTFTGQATSFSGRGDENYAVGYYIEDDQIVASSSLLTDEDAEATTLDLGVESEGLGFSAVIATGDDTDLTVTGSISATDEGDGTGSSDFSGLGTMIVASDGATVRVEDADITTDGFVRAAVVADEYGNVVITDSTITTYGADSLTDVHDGYANSADTASMVSPPWVLGIQGGVRAANMVGTQSSLSVVDTDVTAGSWAVLSTDTGSGAQMTVVDSSLRLLTEAEGGMSAGDFEYSDGYGSGYGTYLIGSANQDFYGVDIDGSTYAAIFAGGTATYSSSTGQIDILDGTGEVIDTVEGDGEVSTIDSVWGFMAHGQATLNLLDGTEVTTEEATFLHKAGSVDITIDDAEIESASGVILQMIDNDDSTVGIDTSTLAFNTTFAEDAGWPSENGNVSSADAAASAEGSDPGVGAPPGGFGEPPEGFEPGGEPPEGFEPGEAPPGGEPPEGFEPGQAPEGDESTVVGADGEPLSDGASSSGSKAATVTMTNGDYDGDLLNGTGYYGQAGADMSVTIGAEATLTGAISLTETRHVDENGDQATEFTIEEYYLLGHVENRNYRNGTATAAVTVTDGGVWVVTGESLLTSLTIVDGEIVGADGADVVITVDGDVVDAEAGATYEGEIVVTLA